MEVDAICLLLKFCHPQYKLTVLCKSGTCMCTYLAQCPKQLLVAGIAASLARNVEDLKNYSRVVMEPHHAAFDFLYDRLPNLLAQLVGRLLLF